MISISSLYMHFIKENIFIQKDKKTLYLIVYLVTEVIKGLKNFVKSSLIYYEKRERKSEKRKLMRFS